VTSLPLKLKRRPVYVKKINNPGSTREYLPFLGDILLIGTAINILKTVMNIIEIDQINGLVDSSE
jgi:hypothetical protein